MASILNADEVHAFLIANGYPNQYNDGLRAYLRVFFNLPDASLADLFVRYIIENGIDLAAPDPGGDELLLEGGLGSLLQEDGSLILIV